MGGQTATCGRHYIVVIFLCFFIALPCTEGQKIAKDLKCGGTKGCFYDCAVDDTCTFQVTWQEQGNQTLFSLEAKVSPAQAYVAIGLSSDSKMGDDSVTGCTADETGRFHLYNSFNEGTDSNYIDSTGLSALNHSFTNGILACTFLRDKVVNDDKIFNMDKPWVLLVAYGRATFSEGSGKPVLSEHDSDHASTSSVWFNETSIVLTAEDDEPLVIAHGCLMVGAWIFFASIGLVVARHCKPVWTELLFSQKVWFQVHRFCMVFVFLATVVGFALIFVEEGHWSDIHSEDEYLEAHPILGVIVTVLTVINPFMAMCRPKPGSPKRFIFNWAHLLVGEAAHILGVITVFFGIELYDDVPHNTIYVLWAYVGWQIFVEVLLYIVQCTCRGQSKSEMYEMDSNGEGRPKVHHPDGSSDKGNAIKKVILVLHFFVVTVIATIIVTLLAKGK